MVCAVLRCRATSCTCHDCSTRACAWLQVDCFLSKFKQTGDPMGRTYTEERIFEGLSMWETHLAGDKSNTAPRPRPARHHNFDSLSALAHIPPREAATAGAGPASARRSEDVAGRASRHVPSRSTSAVPVLQPHAPHGAGAVPPWETAGTESPRLPPPQPPPSAASVLNNALPEQPAAPASGGAFSGGAAPPVPSSHMVSAFAMAPSARAPSLQPALSHRSATVEPTAMAPPQADLRPSASALPAAASLPRPSAHGRMMSMSAIQGGDYSREVPRQTDGLAGCKFRVIPGGGIDGARSCLRCYMRCCVAGASASQALVGTSRWGAGLQIPVFPTEPTSAVAYFLTSSVYHAQLQQMRAEVTADLASLSGAAEARPPNPTADMPHTPRSATAGDAGSATSASFSRPPSPPSSVMLDMSLLPSLAGTANPSLAASDAAALGPPLDASAHVSADSGSLSAAAALRLEEPPGSVLDAITAHAATAATTENEVRRLRSTGLQK